VAGAYRLLIRAIEVALGVLLVLLATIVPLGVLFRYVLNSALSWTDEVGGFTLVWITFLGSVIALDRGVHLDMDLLTPRLKPRLRRATRAVSDAALAVLLVVIVVNGWTIATRLFAQSAVSIPLSRGLIQIVMPLSAILMLVVLAARWWMPEATAWGRRRADAGLPSVAVTADVPPATAPVPATE
jgi:TRAP-type C4-dicarboxylate transport system permease small subunit